MIYKAPKSQKESGRIKRIRAHTVIDKHLTLPVTVLSLFCVSFLAV